MKTARLLLFCLISIPAIGQVKVDTTIKLDLLRAPSSPAFNILGIANSDIERPTDVTSFALSLQEASNNFTTIPRSYGIQVAPFLLGRRKFLLGDFDSSKQAFKQSFIVSTGFTHQGPEGSEDIDSLKTTKLGFGIKFSLVRPAWTDETRGTYLKLIEAQKQLVGEARKMDSLHEKRIRIKIIRERMKELNMVENKTESQKQEMISLANEHRDLEVAINEDVNNQLSQSSEYYDLVKNAANELKNERRGFFLDFSGGFAMDFVDNSLGKGKLYRGGAWLTGGNENGNRGITSMFIGRYLYNPETIFADPNNVLKEENISTFDAGARFLVNAAKGKFSFSSEALYRSILGNGDIDPSWRLVFNTEYDVGFNKKLTFSFGRDFDGTVSKGGNLVAALNLLMGFGSERASQ
jgi:hypothetical protein